MTSGFFVFLFGPRVPAEELRARRGRYLLPTLLIGTAAILLVISIVVPYWRMTLHAPQYPGGLHVRAYLNHLSGDVREIDGLNHYIGMRPLGEAAQLERSLSIMGVGVLSLLVLAAIFVHNRWAAFLSLPALLFPGGFLLDLHLWLSHFGRNLDPHAPLSAAIKPFTPPVLGEGTVGQFRTVAMPDIGLILAAVASLLILIGLWAHRRAYKPLVERMNGGAGGAASAKAGRPRSESTPEAGAGASPRDEKPPRKETGRERRAAGLTIVLWMIAGVAWISSLAMEDGSAAETGGTGFEETTAPQGGFDLAAAIAAAPVGGEVRVPPGLYRGPFVLDRRVALVGEPGAVLEGPGRGDVVDVTAPGVVIRGFTIRGTGRSLDQENAGITVQADSATIEENEFRDVLFGVYLKDAEGCVIRRNRIVGMDLALARRGDPIRLWHSRDCLIEGNVVVDGRDVVIWFSEDVTIRNNRVTGGRYGLHFMYSDRNLIEDNVLSDNSVGGFLMYSRNLTLRRNVFAHNRGPSGYGIGLKDMDGVVVVENRFTGNRIGLYIDNSPRSVDVSHSFHDNLFAYNDVGIELQPAVRRNSFWNNTFLENLEQVALAGSGQLVGNSFTRDGNGNFWSDYLGYDLDGDGLGDVPYRAESLFEALIDRDTRLRLFLFSPVQQAIEMASRAFPTIKPTPKITDDAPLMTPVVVPGPPLERASAWPMWALGAGLLAGSLVVSRPGMRRRARRSVRPPSTEETIMTHDAAPESREAIVEVRGLTKRYGDFKAVDGLDFEVWRGEAVALWGPNGAGKTTAIRCLLGLVRCDGSIEVAGHDLRKEGRAVRRRLGYVPQELALYDDLSVVDSLGFYARLKKVGPDRIPEVLDEVGLAEQGGKRVSELSGGMKQRLALAAALLADPPLLVLDEMTSNLDAEARSALQRLLGRLKARGKTILFTSHRVDEIETLADRVVVLVSGRLAATCRPGALAETVGLSTRLKLFLEPGSIAQALEVLASGGFSARRNGSGIYVEVSAARKLDPIRRLEESRIRVRNFEVETVMPDGGAR